MPEICSRSPDQPLTATKRALRFFCPKTAKKLCPRITRIRRIREICSYSRKLAVFAGKFFVLDLIGMQKVLTAEQMREVDRLTTERYGIPSILLMENAAHAVARVITEKLGGSVKEKSILLLCGPGNNGGDGAALARILWEQSSLCLICLFGRIEDTNGDARVNFEIAKNISSTQAGYSNGAAPYLHIHEIVDANHFFRITEGFKEDVCVDALFGTGFRGPIDKEMAKVVRTLDHHAISGRKSLIVSIDIPSGVMADSAELDSDISDDLVEAQMRVRNVAHPDVTVTFTSPKIANLLPPASRCSEEFLIAQIGTPPRLLEEAPSTLYVTEEADARGLVLWTRFRSNSFKNKRGQSLIVAGSESYSGAAVLAGNAAMRSGVGLVTIATPKSSKDSIASRTLPEVMVKGVSETNGGAISEMAFEELQDLLEKVDSVAIGSGLSLDEGTARFVEAVVRERRQTTIVDADALTLLSPFGGIKPTHLSKELPSDHFPLILTPHEGEFMRLLGTDDKDAIKDRVAAVREFATKNNVILVLKGERVLIGEPRGKVVVNPTGNSGLGKAGNGDTLTGILAGFIAQAAKMNIGVFETVVAAVYVAGMAGDVAEKKYGKRVMTASDVRECLTDVFQVLSK